MRGRCLILAATQLAGFAVMRTDSDPAYTVSSVSAPYPMTALSYAILSDGNPSTGFGSASQVGETVTVDFGATLSLAGMQAQIGAIPGWGNPLAYNASVAVSAWVGGSWIPLATYSQSSLVEGWNTVFVAPVQTSQIRLVGTGDWFGFSGLRFL